MINISATYWEKQKTIQKKKKERIGPVPVTNP